MDPTLRTLRRELASGRLLALLWAVGLVAHCLLLGAYPASLRQASFLFTGLLVYLELVRVFAGWTRPLRVPGVAGLCVSAFVALLFVQVLWLAPASWLALGSSLVWLQVFAACWLGGRLAVDPQSRVILLLGLVLAALGCTVLGVYQYQGALQWLPLGRLQDPSLAGRASGGFAIPNSYAGLILLLLPVSAVLSFLRVLRPWQRVLAAYVGLVLLAGLLMSQSRGAWLCLLLVLAAWPVLMWRGRLNTRLAVALLLVCLSIWSAVLWREHSEQARSRLDALLQDGGERSRPVMWKAALNQWFQHPVLGGGAGTYAPRFEAFRPESLQADPVHAHNEYLEVLAEQGVVGLLFLVCALLYRLRQGWFLEDEARGPRRALVAGLLAFACQLFLDYHLRIPALALCFGTCLGLVAPAQATTVKGGTMSRLMAACFLVGLAGFLYFVVLPYQGAEALRQSLARESPALRTEDRLRVLREALVLWPQHGQVRADLSGELVADGLPLSMPLEQRVREAESQARQALELSSLPWEPWVRLGVALDLQGRWREAGPCYLEAMKRAPNRLQSRYFLAWHLSLNPLTQQNAVALLEACLLLDPFHPQSQALLRQLQERTSLPASPP